MNRRSNRYKKPKTNTTTAKRTSNPRVGRKRGSVDTKKNMDLTAASRGTNTNPRATMQSKTRDKVKTVKTKGGDYAVSYTHLTLPTKA